MLRVPGKRCPHSRLSSCFPRIRCSWRTGECSTSGPRLCVCVCVCAQFDLTLCNPMDCSPPGFSVHGIFQARILKWVAISSFKGSSNPGIEPASLATPALAGVLFTTAPPGKPVVQVKVTVTPSCPTLCDPVDCTVHRILQATILEWVAVPFSRGSSQPRDQTQVSHTAGRFFTS